MKSTADMRGILGKSEKREPLTSADSNLVSIDTLVVLPDATTIFELREDSFIWQKAN